MWQREFAVVSSSATHKRLQNVSELQVSSMSAYELLIILKQCFKKHGRVLRFLFSFITFVKKKDGGLHPCQDYRYVNEHTIRDAYPLPLISDLVDKL